MTSFSFLGGYALNEIHTEAMRTIRPPGKATRSKHRWLMTRPPVVFPILLAVETVLSPVPTGNECV